MFALSRRFPSQLGSLSGKLGVLCVLLLLVIGYLSPLAFDLDPYSLSENLRAKPGLLGGAGPLLGTDDLGRDVLSRLVYGARSSVGIGLAVVVVSMLLGTLLGLLAGVYGGWVEAVIMRANDVLMTLPSILLAIVVVAVLGTGLLTAMLAVTVVSVPGFVRIVRSVAALEMKKQYVQAARTGGSSRIKILWSEVLPNCWGPIIAQATLGFSDAILQIAALGFLGLGAKPPVAEWGVMLADARPFIESDPHLIILPGLCLLVAVLGFNLLGDTLQQRLDPKARTGR
jgi:peptide/nickel transport system permease protein/dipeptide transport system permease protein